MKTESTPIRLCNATKSHAEWLSLMNFGLHSLISDQLTLIECIFAEAAREKERNDKPRNKQELPAIAWEIFDELGLKIIADF